MPMPPGDIPSASTEPPAAGDDVLWPLPPTPPPTPSPPLTDAAVASMTPLAGGRGSGSGGSGGGGVGVGVGIGTRACGLLSANRRRCVPSLLSSNVIALPAIAGITTTMPAVSAIVSVCLCPSVCMCAVRCALRLVAYLRRVGGRTGRA